MQNMLKYISCVHENHSNNPIKLIVHLLISFGSGFTLALGVVYDEKPSQPRTFCNNQEERKQKKTAYLANDSPHYSPLTHKTNLNELILKRTKIGNSVY